MTKKKKITLSIISLLLISLLTAVLVYYFGASHPVYNNTKKDEFNIPGLNEKFVPQGFDFDESTSNYFISGYMADSSASRIYFLNTETPSEYKYVTLTVDNEAHTGHMGGIAVGTKSVWVSSDKTVYRLDKSEILNAKNQTQLKAIDFFTPGNGADSITIHNNKLWVGEFYMEEKYETPEIHHIEVENGETNRAIAYCYEIDETLKYGIKDAQPIAGISLPDKVQGFDFTEDGKLILSTSYSIPKSHILVYEDVISDENKIIVKLSSGNVPIYKASSSKQVKDIEAPSMSEEVVVKDSRLFILYESACSKYKLVNRTRITQVQSIEIN